MTFTMTQLVNWVIFGTLVGSLGTYLLYDTMRRDAQLGAVIGAAMGAVGNLVLLIPFWVYIATHGKQPELVPAGSVGMMTALEKPTEQRRLPVDLGRLTRPLIYLFLILMVVAFLMPVYTVVMTSLKTPDAAGQLNQVWQPPDKINWASYSEALDMLGPKLRNSFILTISATIISSVMGSMNGYVLSKWRFPGANIVFPLMLFGMFIPYQSILIPLFQFMQDVNLGGSLVALIIAHVVYGLPITTLIFRNYYVEVPTDMIEAGAIDGAGFFGIYRWIVFPLSLPGFVVVIIWQFTQIWNEFLFAVTLTNQSSQPITVALALLAGGEAVKWNLPMAGAVLAALPTLAVYIFLGRYFIRGLMAGSVKG